MSILKISLLALLIVLVVVVFQPGLLPTAFNLKQQNPLCTVPIRFSLGTLDDQFNLPSPMAKLALNNAALAWNQALGQQVFVYDDASEFKVDFSYDERQANKRTWQRLDKNLGNFDNRITLLSDKLKNQQLAFEEQLAQFNQAQTELNALIAQFNALTPALQQQLPEQYQHIVRVQDKLSQQKSNLEQDQKSLKREQDFLNSMIKERNNLLNDAPTTGQKRTEIARLSIEQGQRHMTVFAYSDIDELHNTLLHEFGHALGLDHLPTANSIMFDTINHEQNGLHLSDITAAQQACPNLL